MVILDENNQARVIDCRGRLRIVVTDSPEDGQPTAVVLDQNGQKAAGIVCDDEGTIVILCHDGEVSASIRIDAEGRLTAFSHEPGQPSEIIPPARRINMEPQAN